MCTSKTKLFQRRVGVPGEVAIGEKQQLSARYGTRADRRPGVFL